MTEHPEVLTSPSPATAAAWRTCCLRTGFATLLVDDNARYRNQLRRMVSRALPAGRHL